MRWFIGGVVRGILLVGVMLAAREAAAVPLQLYNGTACRGISYPEEKKLTRSGGTITATSATTVVCPVPKLASGPSIYDDRLTQVAMTAGSNTGSSVTVTCRLMVYVNIKLPVWNTNVIGEEVGTGTGINNFSVAMSSYVDNYWGDGTSTSPWKYAQVECSLPSGARIFGYGVNESGTIQPGRRIVSAAACTPQLHNVPSGTSDSRFDPRRMRS